MRQSLFVVCSSLLLAQACSRTAPPSPKQAAKKAAAPVRISQFYASPGVIPKGGAALICYGVEEARAVAIDPPVEQLRPSLARCFEVSPRVTTEYRLTAEGAGGQKVFSSLSIVVRQERAARKEKNENRLILFFVSTAEEVERGLPVTFCYGVSQAETVRIEPEVMPLEPSERRCFSYAPERSTTFTLTAVGAEGRVESRRVTVRVR